MVRRAEGYVTRVSSESAVTLRESAVPLHEVTLCSELAGGHVTRVSSEPAAAWRGGRCEGPPSESGRAIGNGGPDIGEPSVPGELGPIHVSV